MFQIVLKPAEKAAINIAMRRHVELFESFVRLAPQDKLIKQQLEDTKAAYVKIGVFL